MQPDHKLHFGLGDAREIASIRIEWPSGIVQTLSGLEINKIHKVIEPPGLRVTAPGKLQVTGWKDVEYGIEVSTDLRAWQQIGVVKGSVEFTDTEGANAHSRFYRASATP